MNKASGVKKSTKIIALGLISTVGGAFILYSGCDVRANPDLYNDIEKSSVVMGNFAGIIGIAMGCLAVLMGSLQILVERDQAASKKTLKE